MKIIILGVIFPDTLLLGESDEVLAKGTYRHSKMIDCDLVYIKDKDYDDAGYTQIGSVHYGPERLEGFGDVYASPVAPSGYIFLPDQDRNVAVFKHGIELKGLSHKSLDDSFSASPAIVDDRIYLRGHRYLYCVANMNN